jgi:hypothetical protein
LGSSLCRSTLPRRGEIFAIHKYTANLTRMPAMYECDILTDDDDNEMAYRERATALLDEIAAQARQVLTDAGIRLNVYFIVPPSGDAILTLGAVVGKEEWQDIRAVVSSLVRKSIGLEPARGREIVCAGTNSDGRG